MKTRISKLILITFLLGVVFLLHSCGETAASTNPTAPTETPDVISAAEEYADVINESLKAATKFDFDGMHQHYAADAVHYWPDGTIETRTSITGKAEMVAWWKKWQATSGIEKMEISNINLVPLQVNKPLKYYNIMGTVVLAYFDNLMVYNGQPVSVRMHWAYAFNDDKKITAVFSYYDRSGIIETVKANLIKSGAVDK
ncbi:MAG: nuclear transport factor 2 family protein [Phaeodactylibacter sp.]|nr:nuclear transport factor 2 family protein [Phaeodactylibacter sp.]